MQGACFSLLNFYLQVIDEEKGSSKRRKITKNRLARQCNFSNLLLEKTMSSNS